MLNDDMPSTIVVDPTDIDVVAEAGDDRQALFAELPAATTTVTPDATAAATASFIMALYPPPRLRFATHLLSAFAKGVAGRHCPSPCHTAGSSSRADAVG